MQTMKVKYSLTKKMDLVMLDNNLIQETQKFFKNEVAPNLFKLEETNSQLELNSLYFKIKKFGLFNLELSNEELSLVLYEVSRFDASIALTLLSHYMAKSIIEIADKVNPINNIYTCDIYNLINPEEKTIQVHFLPGFTDYIIIPNANIESASFKKITADELNLKNLKTIGSLTSPIYIIPDLTYGHKTITSIQNIKRVFLQMTNSIACGIIQGTTEAVKEYAAIRTQGGKTIKNWSQVKYQLGEIFMEGNISHLLLTQSRVNNLNESEQLSINLKIKNNLIYITDQAISIFGGFGYMKEYPLEKRYRDARHVVNLFSIGNQNQLVKIAEEGYHEHH